MDDTMVVELLFRMSQSSIDCHASTPRPSADLRPLAWGCRRSRSRKAIFPRKNREIMRLAGSSPTTPLSWSPSLSDESSRDSDRSSFCRSKGTFSNENNPISARRLKKRKSFAELKEDDTITLMRKMTNLKKELTSLHGTLKEQRQRSENFKRPKFDFHLPPANASSPTPLDRPELKILDQDKWTASSRINNGGSVLSRHTSEEEDDDDDDDQVLSDYSKQQKDGVTLEKSFVLPDLNMTPPEELS